MRSFLLALGAAATLLVSTPAFAQFANRAIGATAGYLKLNEENGLDWGIPVGIFWDTYLDAGFEFTVRANAMFLQEPVTFKTVVGVAPQVGIRYLLLQEHFRPYVGLDLSVLGIIYNPEQTSQLAKVYFGPGPNVGFEYFVSDEWSIGLRGQYNLYYWFNSPLQSSFGATLEVAAHY